MIVERRGFWSECTPDKLAGDKIKHSAHHPTQHPPHHRDRRDAAPFSPGALQTSSLPLFPRARWANKVAELLHWRRSRARRGLFTAPPLQETPQPASLGLPPLSDRSLRPRRALAQDRHAATVTNTPPHRNQPCGRAGHVLGARSEARSSEVCSVSATLLRALGTLAPNPGFLR